MHDLQSGEYGRQQPDAERDPGEPCFSGETGFQHRDAELVENGENLEILIVPANLPTMDCVSVQLSWNDLRGRNKINLPF